RTTALKGEVDSDGFAVDWPGRFSGTCLCRHEGHHRLGLRGLAVVSVPRTVSMQQGSSPKSKEERPLRCQCLQGGFCACCLQTPLSPHSSKGALASRSTVESWGR